MVNVHKAYTCTLLLDGQDIVNKTSMYTYKLYLEGHDMVNVHKACLEGQDVVNVMTGERHGKCTLNIHGYVMTGGKGHGKRTLKHTSIRYVWNVKTW